MSNILTEAEAKQKIAELIKQRPKLARYQYMIECRLSYCRTTEERIILLANMIKENQLKMVDSFSDLTQEIKKT